MATESLLLLGTGTAQVKGLQPPLHSPCLAQHQCPRRAPASSSALDMDSSRCSTEVQDVLGAGEGNPISPEQSCPLFS